MKTKYILSITVVLFFAGLIGCGEPDDPNAPLGMRSAVGHVQLDGNLYTREGKLFGVVTDADTQHKFPNGEIKSALRVRLANDKPTSPGVWMVREEATKRFYVNK